MTSYRDLEAYRWARSLMVDAYAPPAGEVGSEPSNRLSKTALSVAIHIVDGTSCEEPEERRRHLEASLAAVAQLASLIEDCEQKGELPQHTAEEMLTLQEKAAASLRRSLRELALEA